MYANLPGWTPQVGTYSEIVKLQQQCHPKHLQEEQNLLTETKNTDGTFKKRQLQSPRTHRQPRISPDIVMQKHQGFIFFIGF